MEEVLVVNQMTWPELARQCIVANVRERRPRGRGGVGVIKFGGCSVMCLFILGVGGEGKGLAGVPISCSLPALMRHEVELK